MRTTCPGSKPEMAAFFWICSSFSTVPPLAVPVAMDQGLRRLYGDWLVGLREMLFSPALARTASSVRPSFRPITRVGVFSWASCLSCLTSAGVHCLPWLAGGLAMMGLLSVVAVSWIAGGGDRHTGHPSLLGSP